MKNINQYQRLIAGALRLPTRDGAQFTQRTLLLFLTLLMLALLPVALVFLATYPLQAAFILLLGASLFAIGRG